MYKAKEIAYRVRENSQESFLLYFNRRDLSDESLDTKKKFSSIVLKESTKFVDGNWLDFLFMNVYYR